MFQDRKTEDDELKMPSPIIPYETGDFINYLKGSDIVFRINKDDGKEFGTALRLLGGLINAKLTPVEMEHLRDLMYRVTGS